MIKKNIHWGKLCASTTLFLLFTMVLPTVFANNYKNDSYTRNELPLPVAESNADLISTAGLTYERLNLETLGLSYQAYNYAVCGLEKLKEKGKLVNDRIISIVDFSKPSSEKRLFIIDLVEQKLLYHTYVAHGQKSGKEFARTFSNRPESNQSSLGFYVTSETYTGSNGYSMKLEGVERGINDKAEKRAIVMHGAPYVNEKMIQSQGYIGRSWGCPAVPEKLNRPIIETIKNGTCLFIYAEKNDYFRKSVVLNS